MTKKIFLLFLCILSLSFEVSSQNTSQLIEIYDEMNIYEHDKNYEEVIRISNILITKAPVNSELHLIGYTKKANAENKLGDYRNAIISASKALQLDTKIALMIRQADLPLYIKKTKTFLYLARGFAKDSIGLMESSEADIKKAREFN